MVSVAKCGREPVAPSSSAGVKRDASESPSRSGGPYLTLRSSREFQEVFRTGRSHRRGGVVVIQAPGPPGPPRVGLVTSRRVGAAVQRNRARRRLREAFRQIRLEDDTRYVVVASAAVVDAPFSVLVGWLRDATEGERS